MTEYLPIPTANERSQLEASQRSAGLQIDSITTHWQATIIHPITRQQALIIQSDNDKEFLSTGELSTLLSQEQVETADWFLQFEELN